MTILVTGAAGFIGYHLATCLKQRGDFVIGLDNFNAYYDPHLKRDRVAQLQKQGIEVAQADVCDQNFLKLFNLCF